MVVRFLNLNLENIYEYSHYWHGGTKKDEDELRNQFIDVKNLIDNGKIILSTEWKKKTKRDLFCCIRNKCRQELLNSISKEDINQYL